MVNELTFISARDIDYEFIRSLRNAPELSRGFIVQVHITPEQQADYMAKYANCYFVALKKNEPVGFIGVVGGDLRLAVAREHQRQGIASYMLRQIEAHCIDYIVRVKPDNIASLRMFMKNGFSIEGTAECRGVEILIMKKAGA